jgi:hypothetical protein
MAVLLLLSAGIAAMDVRGGSDLIDEIHFRTDSMGDSSGMLRVSLTYLFNEKKKRQAVYWVAATKQGLRQKPVFIFGQEPVKLAPDGERGGRASITLTLEDKIRYAQFHIFAKKVEPDACKRGRRCVECKKWGFHLERLVDSTSRFNLRAGIDQKIIKGKRGR